MRVTFLHVPSGHAPLLYEPCGPAVCYPEFAHENKNFTCVTITAYLHLVEGSEKLQYGKAPELGDIGGLVRADFFIPNPNPSPNPSLNPSPSEKFLPSAAVLWELVT